MGTKIKTRRRTRLEDSTRRSTRQRFVEPDATQSGLPRNECYRQWERRLITMVQRRYAGLDFHEITSAMDDAWCEFMRKVARMKKRSHCSGLLLCMVFRRVVDQLRKRQSLTRNLLLVDSDYVEIAPDITPDPAHCAENRDILALIATRAAEFPRRQRQAAYLLLSSCCGVPRPKQFQNLFVATYGEPITVKAASRLVDEVVRKLRASKDDA